MSRTIVVNATNLGRYLDGIGTYTLNFLKQLAAVAPSETFVVYINRRAAIHLEGVRFPACVRIVRVTGLLSPDFGFRGHLLRLLFANYLGLRHPRALIFCTSQLEAVFFRRNQVIMIHDLIPLLFRSCHRRQYLYFRYLLPMVLHRARAILTPSEHTRELLREQYRMDREKITVIAHGVGGEFATDRRTETMSARPYILFVGRVTQMKNLDGILRAYSLIQRSIPHSLVLVGMEKRNGERQFATSQLSRYGVDARRVVVKGYLSTKEMAGMLRGSSLLVFPSFYEGFGLPAIEAMAAGCPVVTSRVSSLPEVCGDAALYVDPVDPRSIAHGIRQVLADSLFCEELIRRGKRRVREYTWEKSFEIHLRVIRGMREERELARIPQIAPSRSVKAQQQELATQTLT